MAKEEKTLEEVFAELENVIGEMEKPDVSLEDSFRLYHKGMIFGGYVKVL